MRKYVKYVALLVLVCSVLAGCGDKKKELKSDSVVLNDNGSVEAVMVESFDQSYYKESELMDMVNKEVSEYNSLHGKNKIKVESHSLKDGKMTLKMKFSGYDVYNDYMPDKIHVGKISSAYSAGYDLNRSLVDAKKDSKTIGKAELTNMADSKVIVVNKATTVRCPSKVKYYSQGMEKVDDYTVSSSEAGCYFVIY